MADPPTDRSGLAEGLRDGAGLRMLSVLVALTAIAQLDRVALAVLAPDIQASLGIDDTTLTALVSVGGVGIAVGALPIAWLADRVRRTRLVATATAIGGVVVLLQGLVVNAFQLFWARTATGLAQSNRLPVHGSLLADGYPRAVRGRVFALDAAGTPIGLLAGPLVAAGIAAAAGGGGGWRVAFVAVAALSVAAALAAGALAEPPREAALPAVDKAVRRLRQVDSFPFLGAGLVAVGFALAAVPVQLSLLLEDSYGYGAYTRGWMIGLTWAGALAAMPAAGWAVDRLLGGDPARTMRLSGALIAAFGLLVLAALRLDQPAALVGGLAVANACVGAAFVGFGPTVAAVAPYRIRAQAFALLPIGVFLAGGFFGGLVVGALSDAHGERTALTMLAPPVGAVAGLLVAYGSRHAAADAERALAELRANKSPPSADPPVIEVERVDFGYGHVQVLFGVTLAVRRGETLALLGTNGAGKSTLLRAISGLGEPLRGTIRLNGEPLAFTDPEERFRRGIVHASGVFSDLSVEENLRAAVLAAPLAQVRYEERSTNAFDVFPDLADARSKPARALSGGQQQMLALAMALMHRPQLLLIDELSMGLAPAAVEDVVAVVERLRSSGQTMIVVEQSIDVALSIADRAVFMEKGRVRFEGAAAELAARHDLVRAVFLGGPE